MARRFHTLAFLLFVCWLGPELAAGGRVEVDPNGLRFRIHAVFDSGARDYMSRSFDRFNENTTLLGAWAAIQNKGGKRVSCNDEGTFSPLAALRPHPLSDRSRFIWEPIPESRTVTTPWQAIDKLVSASWLCGDRLRPNRNNPAKRWRWFRVEFEYWINESDPIRERLVSDWVEVTPAIRSQLVRTDDKEKHEDDATQSRKRAGSIVPPRLLPSSHVAPQFPEQARNARLDEGRVTLSGIVGVDGVLHDVIVVQCTPSGMGFEEAALEAASQWRYKPATRDGEPVETIYSVLVRFSH